MGMLGTAVHLELFDHRVAKRPFGQHALDGFFQSAAGVFGLHIAEIGGCDTAGITRVTVVHLVQGLGSR